jgi:hypothetical protein
VRKRFPSLVLGVCLVAGLVSCGGDGDEGSDEPLTKAQYQQALIRLYIAAQPVGDLYERLNETHLPPTECASRTREYIDLIGSLIDRLAALNPPAGARQAQDELVAGARTSLESFARVADRAESGELSCGPEYGRLILRGESDSANRAFAELRERGYATFD